MFYELEQALEETTLNGFKERFEEIEIKDITPNANQPRTFFDEEKLQELAQQIKEDGLLQPIVVQKKDDGFIIVAGERRFRACKLNDFKTINCFVIGEDKNIDKLALLENIARSDLSGVEIAMHLKKMLPFYKNQTALAQAIGKNKSYVSKALKVLELPKDVLDEAKKQKAGVEYLSELARTKGKMSEKIKNKTSVKAMRDEKKQKHTCFIFENKDELLRIIDGLDPNKKYKIEIKEIR